jgi:hypothetical protein
MGEPYRFEKEMSETRESLARGLKRLLGAKGEGVAGGQTRLEIAEGGKRLVLEIVDLPPRKFGPVALPALKVTVTLSGYAPAEAEAFRRDFERAFQRGGG